METFIHPSLSCLLPFYTIPIFPLSKDSAFTCILGHVPINNIHVAETEQGQKKRTVPICNTVCIIHRNDLKGNEVTVCTLVDCQQYSISNITSLLLIGTDGCRIFPI